MSNSERNESESLFDLNQETDSGQAGVWRIPCTYPAIGAYLVAIVEGGCKEIATLGTLTCAAVTYYFESRTMGRNEIFKVILCLKQTNKQSYGCLDCCATIP